MHLIRIDRDGPVTTLTIDRPDARNALNTAAVDELTGALDAFEADGSQAVAILTGAGGSFCAGADLKEIADARTYRAWAGSESGMLGAPRSKPLIAAVSGHAVAGGLGVALYCDMRLADTTAVFGVFCRRFGVPMSDGTTVRLPRVIGEARAMDMMLTGRAVGAVEARTIGLVSEVLAADQLLPRARALALKLSAFPQAALRSDRQSLLASRGLELDAALRQEAALAEQAKQTEAAAGASQFAGGTGRHGQT
ncbi:MAG: crotonase/enoyl-CoA hydratase family protein [Pseudomonadota bacterium]